MACMSSCNEAELFKQELYRNEFALISSDNYNVFAIVHDLRETESTGYVAVSMGGTNPTDKELIINLKEDEQLFDRFNKGNYDVDYDRYARLVPKSFYNIDDYTIRVPQGDIVGKMKIRMRPEGLSPDSIYFISLAVDKFSAFEINPDKADILYRVLLKNYYTKQTTSSNGVTYSLRGVLDGGNVIGSQTIFPLGSNSVRIMPANESFEGDTAVINRKSVVLTVGADNKVTVTPFKHSYVEMDDSDPLYPNTFSIEYDGFNYFKTFLLHFKYRNGGESNLKEVREELRLQFNPNDDK
jgi:hypothetical protein